MNQTMDNQSIKELYELIESLKVRIEALEEQERKRNNYEVSS